MKILLTGGSGFIGRNLFEQLREKRYIIYAPSREELDLLDYRTVEQYIKNKKIDIIIHAAIRGGDVVLEQTLRIFMNLLRVIDRVDKIIHFGSGAEYAKTRDLVKIKETEFGRYIPDDLYGLAKYTIHQIVEKEKKIVNLRLFGVYGKYEDYRYKFISNAIVKNLLRLPITIKQDAIFDYLHIADLVTIVQYFINHKDINGAVNTTPSKSIKLSEVAKIINEISSHKSDIIIKNKQYNFQYTGDNTKLKKIMPKLKFTTYENGITELYSYYKTISILDKEAIIRDEYFNKSKTRQ